MQLSRLTPGYSRCGPKSHEPAASSLNLHLKRCGPTRDSIHRLTQEPIAPQAVEHLLPLYVWGGPRVNLYTLFIQVNVASKDIAAEVYHELPAYWVPRWRRDGSVKSPMNAVLLRG